MGIKKGFRDDDHQYWALRADRREGSIVSLSREVGSRNSGRINGGNCSSRAAFVRQAVGNPLLVEGPDSTQSGD